MKTAVTVGQLYINRHKRTCTLTDLKNGFVEYRYTDGVKCLEMRLKDFVEQFKECKENV